MAIKICLQVSNWYLFIKVYDIPTSPPQVQPDMSEVFVPVVDGFLVTLEEAQVHLETLMNLIPALHGAEKKADSILIPAIQAGCAALKAAQRPGKVIMFHSGLPTAPGPGQLKNREDKKLLNTEKVMFILYDNEMLYI